MKITMTAISKRQHAWLYTQKAKQIAKHLYKYTKSQTLFKKLDNFYYVFLYKSHTLDVTRFSWNF